MRSRLAAWWHGAGGARDDEGDATAKQWQVQGGRDVPADRMDLHARAADGGVNALPRVWAENDGCTRMYGVPYSEHSSHTELHNLVSALKPNRIVPTVNAESAEQREKLIGQLQNQWTARPTSAPRVALSTEDRGGEGGGGGGGEGEGRDEPRCGRPRSAAKAVERAHRRRSIEQQRGGCRSNTADGSKGDTSAASSSSSAAVQLPTDADDPLLAQLRDIIGEGAPQEYLKGLLSDSNGDVELACSIHFGANGGVVPEASAEEAAAVAQEVSSSSSPALGASSSRGGPSSSKDDGDEDLALPPGTVAWVVGKEFKLYTSKEALEARLTALGASVVASGSRFAKREVTLIVVPEGMEAGSVVRGSCPDAPIVHESWVVKRAMALRAGKITPAAPPTPASKSAAGKKRVRSSGSATGGSGGAAAATDSGGGGGGGEKRAARYRSMSAAAASRMERAVCERLYLIERRDASVTSPSGLVTLKVVFSVLGSTGNVYEAVICRQPSCTPPTSASAIRSANTFYSYT